MEVRIDFVGDPIVFEEKSEEDADEKEDPAAREPGGPPYRREKRNIHDIDGGIANVCHNGEQNHREKILEMKSRPEVRPRANEPNHANGEKDEVVEDAARLPITGRGKKQLAKGRRGL